MSSSLLETLQALQATTAARIQSYDTERRAGQLAVPCQLAAAAVPTCVAVSPQPTCRRVA